jgi:L-threonylcarbamoyladenylate synthase
VRAVRRGGIIAYPTEAVYGLGCDPLERGAVERLLNLKRRSARKGLILIAAEFDQLRPFLAPDAERAIGQWNSGWPGPHTWLLPAAAGLPYWVNGGSDRVAVRVTAHPVAAALCGRLDAALISTSANRSRHPPARSSLEVRLRFDDQLDYIFPGTTDRSRQPTPVRDAVTGAYIRT